MSNMDYSLFTTGKKIYNKTTTTWHSPIVFAGYEICDIKLVTSGIRKHFEMIINI